VVKKLPEPKTAPKKRPGPRSIRLLAGEDSGVRTAPDSDQRHLDELLLCRDVGRRALLQHLEQRSWSSVGSAASALVQIDRLLESARNRVGDAGALTDGLIITWLPLPGAEDAG